MKVKPKIKKKIKIKGIRNKMHHNRHNIGKFWPIPRKGSKYLARRSHNQNDSVPLVVVMRDVLGLVKSKKELKKAINEKQIILNGKEVRETNYPVSLFDVIGVVSMKKHFKAVLNVSKKLVFEEVSGKDAESKVFKVIGKKVIGKDKVQVNLLHGNNVLVDDNEKINVGDSLVVGFDGKVVKVIAMEKGHVGYVTHGKHTGHKGKIEEIVVRGGKRLAQISEDVSSASKDAEGHKDKKEKITVWVKNVIVVE